MMTEKHVHSETLQFLLDRYVGDDPERIASYECALADADLALQVYKLRSEAKLSQRALAARVGTTASVICRLEDSEYEGHSLAMLRRIAAAVGKRVEIHFVPDAAAKEPPPAAPEPAPRRGARIGRRAKKA